MQPEYASKFQRNYQICQVCVFIEINLAKYISKILTLFHLWMGEYTPPIFLYITFSPKKGIWLIRYHGKCNNNNKGLD